MKTTTLNNVTSDKEITKNISEKLSHYSIDQFINDANRYIKAIEQGRMICSIGSVSSSGMSRTIKFLAPEKNKYNKNRFQYYNFYCFFVSLGYTHSKAKDHYFTIGGCGMDMIFHTNYSIIHKLNRLGFISKKRCDYLCQQTPSII